MQTVKLPAAEWDAVLECLRTLMHQGWILSSLYNEINDQIYDQEH